MTQPSVNTIGKLQIRQVFKKIATYFEHSLKVKQAGLQILGTSDTAMVLARTIVCAVNMPQIQRNACYVFKRSTGANWLCAIDNSYGHDLLLVSET